SGKRKTGGMPYKLRRYSGERREGGSGTTGTGASGRSRCVQDAERPGSGASARSANGDQYSGVPAGQKGARAIEAAGRKERAGVCLAPGGFVVAGGSGRHQPADRVSVFRD